MRPTDLAALTALAVVWGAAFMLIRTAVPDFGPLALTELRVAVAAIILVVLGRGGLFAEIRRRPGAFVVLGLGFSAVPFSLISIAGQTLPASILAVLNATVPLFTALTAAAWLGHVLTPGRLAGVVIGLIGVLAVVGWSSLPPHAETLIAVAASLGAAASFGLSGTFVRQHLADVPPIHLAAGQLGVAAVLLAVPAAASMPQVLPSDEAIAAALALAVVSTSLAWPAYYALLARSGPTAASTVTFLVPVSAAIWGATVLGEHVGPELLPGVGLIVASLALVLGIRPTIGRPLVRRLLPRPTGG